MDARLISQGAEATQIGSEALVSVSEGAGQPQKNIKLGNFADSMAKAVPQKTKDQVSITGLYAKTTDGKMVELTSDSVASVVAGLIGVREGENGLLPFHRSSFKINDKDVVVVNNPTIYQTQSFLLSGYVDGMQVTRIVTMDLYDRKATVVKFVNLDDRIKIYYKGSTIYIETSSSVSSKRFVITLLGSANYGNTTVSAMTYSEFNAITDKVRVEDNLYNFGYNTLDELAAALKPKLGL